MINTNRGDFKTTGEHDLTTSERENIAVWLQSRLGLLATRQIDDIHRTIDQISQASHWAQSAATDVQLDEVTEPPLLAMHDLRSILVRKKADRLDD